MESVNPDTEIPIIEALRGTCFGLGVGGLVASVMFTTGKMEALHAKKNKCRKILLTVSIAVALLFLIAALLATILR
ncbi:MAG: hypothetical protein HUJ72_10470 [Blautia sp.]|nr:hypothetical protein [Blautia sp.]